MIRGPSWAGSRPAPCAWRRMGMACAWRSTPRIRRAGTDIVTSIRRGDISGMSFAFQTVQDQWDQTVDPPIRTVTDMRVREVSVVTFPAYPQTEVALRCLTAARQDQVARYPRGRTVAERRAWATAHGRWQGVPRRGTVR